jgi:Ca2+-binding EF-hand superfamily protein
VKPTVAAGVLLLLPCVLAAGAAEPLPEADSQDVLLLAEAGPVLLRLHVRIDGRPVPAAWGRYLDRLFAYLDRDGDGSLNKAEAARAPAPAFLHSFLHGTLNLEAAAEAVPFDQLDADGDGRVSRREFAAYYRRIPLDRLRVVVVPDRGKQAALTDALFRLLDRDGDGKLSRDELRGAAASLRKVDLNEDEWVTPEELLLHRLDGAESRKDEAMPESTALVPPDAGGPSEEQVRLVLRRFNDKLDAKSLKALLAGPPDLELIVRLGTAGKDEPRVQARGPAKPARRTEEGLLALARGLAMEVQAGPADASLRGLHAFYRQQFEAADADGRGTLDRKQVADVPALAALFSPADRDGDGKLTDKELDTFLDLHALGAGGFATLAVTDRSLGLFDLLDEDGDGRLSLHELHTAWDRLRTIDRDGDGKLDRDEFPHRLRVRLTPGKAAAPAAAKEKPAQKTAPTRGPAWYRKMDRNGDGFVSRREWLGPEELFRKLDTDGDGLLSPEEAARLDSGKPRR